MSSAASLTGGKYNRDLKLRVLEHYFRNGGDVFGNKQATAKKFGVDSKTINRFLKIPELVRAARKNAKSRKSPASSNDGFKEPAAPGSAGRARQSVRITLPTQPDESIVNQTADGNISSIGKLLKIFELGTQEIRDLLASECDLIYECRVCRGLFRSVANLLTHKRRFCTRPAADTRQIFGSGPGQSLSAPSDGVVILPLPETISRLPEVRLAAAAEARAEAAEPVPQLRLEPLPGSAVAVAQTVGEPERSVGERIREVERMEAAAGRTVRLGRDGRVVEDGEEEQEEEQEQETEAEDRADGEEGRHVCQYCNTTFSTRKTLSHHVRSLHSSTRVYYPCSLCSAAFINMFSVERHLQKVHKKKQEEVDVLKEAIKRKAFYRNVTESQAAATTVTANMPMKVKPPPNGLLRCVECLVCYPSVQLLAAHQLIAHARTAERHTGSAIHVRNDYLCPPADQSAPATMATIANPAGQALFSPPPPPPPPPAAEPPAASDADMESQMAALADMKRMRCRQCNSVHKTTFNLRRHVANHIGFTRHGCPRCSHRFYMRFDVLRHMKRMHGVTALQAEALLRRHERQRAVKERSGRRQEAVGAGAAAAREEPAAVRRSARVMASEAEREEVQVNAPPVEAVPGVSFMLNEPSEKTYEMRDLSGPRSSPSFYSTSRLPDPRPGSSPACPLPPLPLPPQVPLVAPPPTLTPRRPGRKNLTDIIHYIRSSAEPLSPGGSSWSEGTEGDIFQALASSGLTAIVERPRAGYAEDEEHDDDDDAADDASAVSDDDDDLEEFMSLSCGAELEPGAVWRTLPPLVPLLGTLRRGAEALPSGILRQDAAFGRLTDLAQQHDCNENIQHRPPRDTPTPPVGAKLSPESPRGTAHPSPLKKHSTDERNFFPRVLLTDIALRRCNSSPTPARPASPAGSAVYPAGARLDSAAVTSPASSKGSPLSAKGAPNDGKGSSLSAAGASSDGKGSPSSATGAPNGDKGSPLSAAGASGDGKGSPSSARGAPNDGKGSPLSSAGASGDGKGGPSIATGAPNGDKESPLSAAGASDDGKEIPWSTMSAPTLSDASPGEVGKRKRGRPRKAPQKGNSETDLIQVVLTSEATTSADGSPQSLDGRLKGAPRSARPGQRSVSAPGRVAGSKRSPGQSGALRRQQSPGASPPAVDGARGRKANPAAAAATAAAGAGEGEGAVEQDRSPTPTATFDTAEEVPVSPNPAPYVPSAWPPLVRKRSWLSPSEPPDTVISAAEAVKRRRFRRVSNPTGVR